MGFLDRFRTTPEEAAARERFDALLAQIVANPAELPKLLPDVASVRSPSGLSPKTVQEKQSAAARAYADRALADEILNPEEESALSQVMSGLGISFSALGPTLLNHLILARANDGRFDTVAQPTIMAKAGEEVFQEASAELLKEVTLRELRGGTKGVSFRVAKGVRIHTGAIRAKSVVVGTQLETADTGVFAITSRRALFAGARKTLEFRYDKLASVQVYTDAVTLGVTNRQNSSTIRVADGPFVAGMLNAAAQRAA